MFFIKKVLIIFGGNSSEHFISCKSCVSIVQNIDKKIFDYKVAGIDFDGNWYEYNGYIDKLSSGKWLECDNIKIDNIVKYIKSFDVVFPITHGKYGEDGKLQGFLELFDVKFVGCGCLCSSILMDKDISKMLFKSMNLKQVAFVTLRKDDNIEDVLDKLSFPLIVKPASGGSSIGISKANDIDELQVSVLEAFKYDSKVIIEEFIKARELEVAVLEDDDIIVSDIGEIKTSSEFYDYNAKYVSDESYTLIADLPLEIIKKIKDYAYLIFKTLGLSGFSRIDFFYNNDGVYINEVNTIPGFTDISMYPKLLEHSGIKYTDIITKLIYNALK